MQDSSSIFKNRLKEKGYKLTAQRQAVLKVMMEHEGEHLRPEEIYELVKGSYPEIGLATVYRTLALLNRMELVYKLDLNDGCSRYELSRNSEDHWHHHLICLKCNEVAEMEEDLLESLEGEILRKKGFVIKDHKVKFYGYCRKCYSKMKQDK